MSDNPIHDAEREESRGAAMVASEMDIVAACGHFYRKGVCIWCGDVGADWDDVL
jgi:hypothetical protein